MKKLKTTEFRKELKRELPGFKWTVRRKIDGLMLETEGRIQGYRYLSILGYCRADSEGGFHYWLKLFNPYFIAGSEVEDALSKAVRGLRGRLLKGLMLHNKSLVALNMGVAK